MSARPGGRAFDVRDDYDDDNDNTRTGHGRRAGGAPSGAVGRTVMQRGPGQLSSVSDLYVSDEISVLLEEIHDLEPKGHIAPIDDEQEFEINGSQTGGSWLEVTNSMAGTPGSWDSHANYKHQEATRARYNGVVLHYDKKPMKTPSGVIRVLLLVSIRTVYALAQFGEGGALGA